MVLRFRYELRHKVLQHHTAFRADLLASTLGVAGGRGSLRLFFPPMFLPKYEHTEPSRIVAIRDTSVCLRYDRYDAFESRPIGALSINRKELRWRLTERSGKNQFGA